jgi:hypothetical protein
MTPKLMRQRLVDEVMDAYLGWREECLAVDDAYRRWAMASAADAALAFAAYRSALVREEQASHVYADLLESTPCSSPRTALKQSSPC